MDPISHLIETSGETAVLMTKSTAAYDPRGAGNYSPNGKGDVPVRGVPEGKIEDVQGSTGAFTISASSMPANLNADSSLLFWRGKHWTILEVRERYWLGKLNGYTFALGT